MTPISVSPGDPHVTPGDAYAAWHRLAGGGRQGLDFDPGRWNIPLPAQFGRACQRAKWRLGYLIVDCTPGYGAKLDSYLIPLDWANAAPIPPVMQKRRRARSAQRNPYRESLMPGRLWPFESLELGRLNGCPYQGTHTRGNWESDRAVDLNVPIGTPVLALWDGVLNGPQGPIYSNDPALMGERLHLQRSDGAEAYYAHLSWIRYPEGHHVSMGEVIGNSGSAAGVAHLHLATIPMRPDVLLGIDGCD